jgi:hypothetical protein
MNVTGTLEIEVSSVDEWHMAFDYADGLGLNFHSSGVYGTWRRVKGRMNLNLTSEDVNVTSAETGYPGRFVFDFPQESRGGGYKPVKGTDDHPDGSIILEFTG